jgi:hypothetical protein
LAGGVSALTVCRDKAEVEKLTSNKADKRITEAARAYLITRHQYQLRSGWNKRVLVKVC